MMRLVSFKKRRERAFLLSLCSARWAYKERTSANQEEGPHQTPNLPAPWSWTFQPPELWFRRTENFYWQNYPVYVIFVTAVQMAETGIIWAWRLFKTLPAPVILMCSNIWDHWSRTQAQGLRWMQVSEPCSQSWNLGRVYHRQGCWQVRRGVFRRRKVFRINRYGLESMLTLGNYLLWVFCSVKRR